MRSPSGGEARLRGGTQVAKAPPSPEMTISGLTESGLSGKIMSPNNDVPRLCRTLRPAPQAGCFVSGLRLSKDSAQIALRHRAFRTVALAPSSGSAKWPFLSVTQLRPAVGPLCRRAKNRLRRGLRDSPRGAGIHMQINRERLSLA